jgi:hypothetical protein
MTRLAMTEALAGVPPWMRRRDTMTSDRPDPQQRSCCPACRRWPPVIAGRVNACDDPRNPSLRGGGGLTTPRGWSVGPTRSATDRHAVRCGRPVRRPARWVSLGLQRVTDRVPSAWRAGRSSCPARGQRPTSARSGWRSAGGNHDELPGRGTSEPRPSRPTENHSHYELGFTDDDR